MARAPSAFRTCLGEYFFLHEPGFSLEAPGRPRVHLQPGGSSAFPSRPPLLPQIQQPRNGAIASPFSPHLPLANTRQTIFPSESFFKGGMGEDTRDKLLLGVEDQPQHTPEPPPAPCCSRVSPRRGPAAAGERRQGAARSPRGRSPRPGAGSRRIQPHSPRAPGTVPGAPCLLCSFLNHFENNTNRIKSTPADFPVRF